MPQTSGPITQTSPGTERGGQAGQNTQKPSPTKPKKKQTNQEHTWQKRPSTRKLGKRPEVEKPPPKVQENVKQKQISRAAEE